VPRDLGRDGNEWGKTLRCKGITGRPVRILREQNSLPRPVTDRALDIELSVESADKE